MNRNCLLVALIFIFNTACFRNNQFLKLHTTDIPTTIFLLQKFNIPNHQNLSQIILKDIKKNDLQAKVTVLADTVSHEFDVSSFI